MEYIRENISTSHSLHDMVASAIVVDGNDITLRMETGIVRCSGVCEQCEGSVVFRGIDWDFCFVYILHGFTANAGEFCGEKLSLRDFIAQNPAFHFEIIDACYGYNQTKLSGWLSDDKVSEATMELYHTGNMIFVES